MPVAGTGLDEVGDLGPVGGAGAVAIAGDGHDLHGLAVVGAAAPAAPSTAKTWSDLPLLSPITSRVARLLCSAATVPPMLTTLIWRICGDARYGG